MYKASIYQIFKRFSEKRINFLMPSYIDKYTDLFGEKYSGSLVEIGAFDGITYSNTSCFPFLGWECYYVEPIKEYADQCRQYFKEFDNVHVFDTSISGSAGTLVMKKWGAESSAVSYSYYGVGRVVDRKGKPVSVPTQTLHSFLEEIKIKPNFDLLVVDVEGMEWEVLRGFNFNYWRPQVMIIELRDIQKIFNGSQVQADHKKVTSLALSSGYKIYHRDELNTIFQRINNET